MSETLLYPHVRRAIVETPWAILESKLADIMEVVALRAAGITMSADEIQERIGAVRPRPRVRAGGDVAVLPLVGTISHRMGMLSQSSGGTSVEAFTRDFRALVNDPSVAAIVLDVDSPGGSVSGVDELASEIYGARGIKPITAVANSTIASAAYWIASAADEIVVSPSGEVGAIGVIAAHEDQSALYEKLGVKVSLITAGKYKGENNPFEPMTEEGRAAIQARVDEAYGMFISAVARHRGVPVGNVRSGFGEGRMVGAQDAVRMGLADRIATLDEVAAGFAGGALSSGSSAAMAASTTPTLTFEEQAAAALTAVQALQSRVQALTALRVGRPSPIAAGNVPLIQAHRDALLAVAEDYDALLALVPGEATAAPAQADPILLDFLVTEARRNGVELN